MVDNRTDVTVTAKTKGFVEAQQLASRLTREATRGLSEQAKGFDSASKGAQRVEKDIEKLEGALKGLVGQQLELTRVMEEMGDKSAPAYRKLATQLKGVKNEANSVERTISQLDRAFGRQEQRNKRMMSSGAFTQGLLQGAAPGIATFMQRGPGMSRQAAGMALGTGVRGVGRGAMGVAGGMGGAMFSGAGGIAQALSSIPGGGLAAAPLMQLIGQGQQALQFRGALQEQMPYLGGVPQVAQRVRGGKGRIQQQFGDVNEGALGATLDRVFAMEREDLPMAEAERKMIEREGERRGYGAPGGGLRDLGAQQNIARDKVLRAKLRDRAGGEARFQQNLEVNAQQLHRSKILEGETKRIESERATQIGNQAFRTRRMGIQGIREMGVQFGMQPQEALQLMGQVSQVGGGVGREMQQQGMIPAAMAARRMGIGGDVSGAFLQGGRRGGVVGGFGRSGEAMTDAIGEGMKLGLEGSELTEFMSQMASDIRGWKSTGIPLNTKTVGALSTEMGKLGLGGIRGGVAARGMMEAGKGLVGRGPKSAEELIILQEMGFTGGAESLEETQIALEQGGMSGDIMKKIMKRFMLGGKAGVGGRNIFRKAMRGMGVSIAPTEARLMEKQLTGGTLNDQEQATLDKFEAERERGAALAPTGGPEQFAAGTAAAVDPALQRQAALSNQAIRNGESMIGILQDLEQTSMDMGKAFKILAGEPLKQVTQGMSDLAAAMPGFVNFVKKFVTADNPDLPEGLNAEPIPGG